MSQPEPNTIEVQSHDGSPLSVRYFGNLAEKTHAYVCISGLGGTSTAWDVFAHQILGQTPKALIIAIDMRGHNTSSKVFPVLDSDIFKILALDVQAVCRSLNVERPILIGHSMGGIVSLSYLKNALTPLPKKVFTLNVPSYLSLVPKRLHKLLYKLLQAYSKNDKAVRPIFTTEMHARYRNSWDFDPGRVYHDIQCMGLGRYILYWFVILSAPPQKYPLNMTSNIHCVFGTKDLLVSEKNARKLRNCFPNAHWFSVEANHNSVVNKPEAIAQYVLAAQASA